VFVAVSGFDFGFRVRVHRDSTRSESAPFAIPTRPLRAVAGEPGQAPRVARPWVRPWLLGTLYNIYFDAAVSGLAIKTIMNGAGRDQ
jgi:hypothetical protein